MPPKFDLDEIFGYETFKIVKVKDRRLGILHRTFQLCIFIYILYNIIFKQLYLKKEPPVPGAVRITLQAPEILTNPPYCTGGELPCAYWGSNEIHYPNDAAGVAFFTTRATVTKYPVPENCNSFLSPKLPDDPCIFNAKTARSQTIMEKSYIADIENYSVMIEHSVRGKTTSISLRNGMMDGELISANGISIKSWTNKTRTEFTPNANGDILSVKEILDAAGVDLEGPSFAPAAVGESNRSSGVVIVIVIEYKNVPSKDNEIKYKYFPQVINGAEYKVTESIFNNDNSYTIKDRHGIRLVFQQYGQIGEFDFISLLTNLVAALALFKVATFLVELLMLKCLPQKDQYEHFKYEETQDFSEIRKGSDKGSII